MDPKISIIIPVYNVEQYLAECLDSVTNQTLREIQIICVNDGSPDNSRSILQEYADRDSRIEIIDKLNGGQASARNAAYPRIKGEYTLFVDADDWIELDLCEKVYQKAEETNAEMVYFFYFSYCPDTSFDTWISGQMQALGIGVRITAEDKMPFLHHSGACSKMYSTELLLHNNIYYPEGLVMENVFVNWKGVVLAKRIACLPERLYHYRYVPGSTMQSVGKHSLHHVPIYDKVLQFLLESGNYAAYREKFLSIKHYSLFNQYQKLPARLQSQYRTMIRDSMTEDDRLYFHTATDEQLYKTVRLFFAMLDGGWQDMLKYRFARFCDNIGPYIVRVPGARFAVRKIVRPLLKRIAR